MKYFLFLLAPLFLVTAAKGEKVLQYGNYIYEPQIKTVLLYQQGTNTPTPVIKLNTTESLTLSFDELVPENDYYMYTLIHCDAYWHPSDLRPMEYLVGNTFDFIEDFKFSNNTYQKYVHYSMNFPSADMRPKYSGNYLLKIYRNYDENDVIITRRIFVLDARTTFDFDIHPATLAQYRFSKQEVDFKATIKEYQVFNPYQDLKVIISQNNRWDNVNFGMKPQFIVGNEYTYNYEEENLFDGTNEFRFFDSRSLRFLSQNVNNKYIDSIYHLVLLPSERRVSKSYVQYIDFNGKRVIANKDGQNDGSFDGDYAWVYFSLEAPNELRTGDVYVFGELSDWQAKEEFRMTYNRSEGRYECKVLLKQGYYSYLFTTYNQENGQMETIETEGNFMNTENDYYIYVYCRNQSFGYDELIGFVKQSSNSRN